MRMTWPLMDGFGNHEPPRAEGLEAMTYWGPIIVCTLIGFLVGYKVGYVNGWGGRGLSDRRRERDRDRLTIYREN